MSRAKLPTEFFNEDTYTIKPKAKSKKAYDDSSWLPQDPEGQLSVDVFETAKNIVITAPIAGVKPNNLEIYVSQDVITIRGRREDCHDFKDRNYLYQECHWGMFSRSIILPVHVSSDGAEAKLKAGVLIITLPKKGNSMFIPVSEIEDE